MKLVFSKLVKALQQLPLPVQALLYALPLALLFGTPTALIPFPFLHYYRMVPATLLDYFFLAAVSLLLGAYLALRGRPCCGSTAKGAGKTAPKKDGAAVAGAVGGVIAFGCPVCNVLLVSLFGSAAVLAYIEPLRPWLGVAAVFVLGIAAYSLVQRKHAP